MTPEEIDAHCQMILRPNKAHNKIVVLCEGDPPPMKMRRSPQAYAQNQNIPDASFYKNFIPTSQWNQRIPYFVNSGGRKDVIQTYQQLQQMLQEPSQFKPKAVFAIVDLDIQTSRISADLDTEIIFRDLFQNGCINPTKLSQHHIWVTGLIHKEAYFLLPALQPLFKDDPHKPLFGETELNLHTIYLKMADEMLDDKDIENHFEIVQKRLEYCKTLDCSSLEKLQHSWQTAYQAQTDAEKHTLINALLTVRKAKPYWQQIEPDTSDSLTCWARTSEEYREQLSIKIAQFFSKQLKEMLCNNVVEDTTDSRYHIPQFFKYLYDIQHNSAQSQTSSKS